METLDPFLVLANVNFSDFNYFIMQTLVHTVVHILTYDRVKAMCRDDLFICWYIDFKWSAACINIVHNQSYKICTEIMQNFMAYSSYFSTQP